MVGTLRFAHPTAVRLFNSNSPIIPRRHAPEDLLFRFALENREGAGKAGCPQAPAIVRTKCTRVIARCAGTPGLPCAMVLRLIARSSRSRIPLASVADELTISRQPGWARQISVSLTPATGARTTRLCRPRLPPPKPLDRLMCCRPKFRRRRLSAGRLRAGSIAHRPKPALRPLARPTLPRPSHPAPNVRDDRDTPLSWARDGGLVGVIWGNREAEYFCSQHWTKPHA